MMTLRMEGIVSVRYLALLVVGCFVAVAVVCTVLMTGAVGVGSGAHCADKSALTGCLVAKSGHRAVNEFVLVNILLLMAVSVVFVLRHEIRELQSSFFRCWRRFWRAEVLCWQEYLIELFSGGIVRSKIYGSVL